MTTKKPISKLRIIGGKWRSRKIQFYPLFGLRPTPDRVRETLFNWLAAVINDATCLDLFAGSGALGFEALSRGAKSVVMMDQAREVIDVLKQNAQLLQTSEIEYYCAKAPEQIALLQNRQFDIVFLDPPFHQNLIASCAAALEENNCLAKHAYIYIEVEASLEKLHLPPNWQIIKTKKAGQVGYYLIKREV